MGISLSGGVGVARKWPSFRGRTRGRNGTGRGSEYNTGAGRPGASGLVGEAGAQAGSFLGGRDRTRGVAGSWHAPEVSKYEASI